ncbi:hypothetical protein JCM33374_g386 [Metschnikowia sp. JCM 33374]|nr:hypothetical protein JCM33374_g386 [Metschnikowia sp. JCM 33374]
MHFTSLIQHLLWCVGATLMLCLLPPLAAAQSPSMSVTQPGINFDAIGGNIALLGDFDGLSLYDSANASSFLAASQVNSSAVYLRNATSGSSSKIASVEGGWVTSLSRLAADSVLVFGTFSAINGHVYQPPVMLNVSSQEVTPILPQSSTAGVSGSVLTTLVDGNLIYLGGDFEFNNTHGAAVYNLASHSLASLPFQGFGQNSSVHAITKYPPDADDGSILFGGSFHTLGLPELLTHNISSSVSIASNSTNRTLVSAEQVISLKHATFGNINGISSNVDSSVICPSKNPTWALRNNSGGEWTAQLPLEVRGIAPTKVRIYVPQNSSDGIRDFRIYTYPNNGIMNLSYVDPNTNQIAFCDASCPLQLGSSLQKIVDSNIDDADSYSDDDTVYMDEDGSFYAYYDASTKAKNLGYGSNFQEFALVNNVMIDAIGLTTISWYGSRGEFSGFELYSDSITVYGNETLNDSNCGGETMQNTNTAVINDGKWQSVHSLSNSVTNDDYLVSLVDDSSSITLYPNISYAGNYSLLFYTPGCAADNSCSKRSVVNVTVTDYNDHLLSSNVIYQNNLQNKFDYLYFGHLNGSSTTTGMTKVHVDFVRPIDSSATNPWIVVDKVVANIVALDVSSISHTTNSTKNSTSYSLSTMSLNGLFEYSLANFTSFSRDSVYGVADNNKIIKSTNTFVGNSTINALSGNLTGNSVINNIIYSSDSESIFLNGEFFSQDISLSNNNLLSLKVEGYNSTANDTQISSITKRFEKRDDQTILGATFNDSITTIRDIDGGLVALGEFSMSANNGIKNLTDGNRSTTTANNLALYSANEWYSFGNPYYSDDFSQITSLVLNNTEYYVFSSPDGQYLSWDNTHKQWSTSKDKLDISASVALSDNQQVIGGASFGVMDFYDNDQGYLKNTGGFSSFNMDIQNGSVASSYYLNSSFSVIGGSFSAANSIENVALLVNGNGVPLQETVQWSDNTAVTAIYINTEQEFLFMGTNGSGKVHNLDITGLLVYSLKNQTFASIQPPDLSTSDGSPLSVNALALYDQSSQLLVGGNFNFAGSLGCQSVCLYDIKNTRWINPSSSSSSGSLNGVVTDAKFFASDSILLSGNLTVNSTQANFAVYDFSNNVFANAGSQLNNIGVSGTVEKYIMNDNSNGRLNVRMSAIGSNFVIGYNGSTWSRIDSDIQFSEQTRLTDLKLVQLSARNSNNPSQAYFDNNKALLLSGSFNLTNYGMVNVALFDGKSWIPYVFSSKDSTLGRVNSLLLEDLYKSQSSSDLNVKKKQLSVGQVVGISLACAIGSTAIIGFLYLIPVFFLMRGSKKKDDVDQRIQEDEMMDIVNPKDLIHEMDAQRNY